MGNLDDPQPSHGEAIAHMLGKVQWRMTDKFETDMLNTLCVAVVSPPSLEHKLEQKELSLRFSN